MARRYQHRTSRSLSLTLAGLTATEFALQTTNKAVTGFAHFATKDHFGISRKFLDIPPMGFIDTIKHIMFLFFLQIIGAIVYAGSMYLFIAYGIPFLIMTLLK